MLLWPLRYIKTGNFLTSFAARRVNFEEINLSTDVAGCVRIASMQVGISYGNLPVFLRGVAVKKNLHSHTRLGMRVTYTNTHTVVRTFANYTESGKIYAAF
jgi:hypothetical protein